MAVQGNLVYEGRLKKKKETSLPTQVSGAKFTMTVIPVYLCVRRGQIIPRSTTSK